MHGYAIAQTIHLLSDEPCNPHRSGEGASSRLSEGEVCFSISKPNAYNVLSE
jgi:hypothetical protein